MDITRLGIDISDCCNYLDSNKVTERKKRVLELNQLLEIPRSIDLLNENSEKERGLCWDNVFSAVHRCLLKEIDRLLEEETKKGKLQPATELAISSCCGLQVLVVTQANTGTPYLSCHELFSCILQILEQYNCNYKSIVILEAYINILGLALSCEKYWGEIDFQIWKALLQVCVSLLRVEISEKIKSMLISIINVIILQAGKMTSLILKSKSLLSLFPAIFKELVPSRYPPVELYGIQLSYTMCLQFGKEFPLAVDQFIDEMLPTIMKLNDNRVSSDAVFKELISQLLIEIVSIKTLKSDWHQESNSLVKFVENELADISKHKLFFPKEPKVITLGVKLAKYLAKDHGHRSECEESDPKRRKTNTFIGGVLDNFYVYPQFPWPWLCYMDNLIEMAPEVVLDEDIHPLLDYLSKNMTLISDPICLQYMTMSSLRLLNISKGKIADKSCSDFLNFLWATAIRFVNHPKLREVGLTLVSNLLSNDEWINYDSATSILELYLESKIEVTKASLTTLSQFSAAGFLSTTDTRIRLLQWYFKGEIYSVETLLCLLLRSKFPRCIPTLQTDFPLTEVEHFHIIATLGIVPAMRIKSSPVTVSLKETIEDKTVSLEFMKLLPNKLKEVNSLERSLYLTTSLLSLSNSLKKYNLSIATRFSDILTLVVTELLSRTKESLSRKNHENHVSLIKEATNFFEELANFSSSFLNYENSLDILNVLLEQLKLQHVSICGIEGKPSLKRIDIDKNESIKEEQPVIKMLYSILALLKSFSLEDKLKTYIHLINYCKNNISLASKSGFQIASVLLQHIISSHVGSIELLKHVISLITKLSNKWYTYCNEVLQVLQILTDTIPLMLLYDKKHDFNTQIHKLLSSFSKHINKKRYGPVIISKYVSVLACICEYDPDGVHIIDHENGKKQHISYYMLEFLNSPFHQVRISTSEHISILFNKELLTSERSAFLNQAFNIILSSVNNLFLVKEGKSPEEVREEALNRTCCVLKIFLSLICSSPLWRRKALYELFNTIAVKNISQLHFDKIHHYLERNLKIENCISFFEQNLDYILWEWYKSHKSFEKIPYLLLKFNKIEDFYADYKSIIVPIYLENLDINGFQKFCDYLNSTPKEVAIECFPEILSCLIPKLGTDLQSAAEFHHIITKILGPKIKELMSAELKQILLNVFMKLSDCEYLNKLCDLNNTMLPTETPFNTTAKGLENALEYIQRTTPEPREFLLIFLCNKYPNYIQYIMHNLLAHVHLATTKEIRSLCFLQFIAMVDGLITDLTKIKSMAGFLVRHTFYALIQFLNTDIALLALHYLHRFVEIALRTSVKLVDYFIDILYPAIFKISQEDPLGNAACKFIKLLNDSKVDLPSLIPMLPPTESSLSLSKEIDIFLQRQSIDSQALDRLLLQLEKSQKELSAMFEETRRLRYSTKDCATSPVHKIVSKLVILATSPDDLIKDRAAECLGRIGPRNLNTLALQPDLDKEPPSLSVKVVTLLLPLLVHNDLETCELAVTAILEVFETKEGLEALDDMDMFQKTFLTPFIYLNKKTKSISKDYSVQKLAWASMQDSESLSQGWCVWSGSDHSEWVRMAVSRLLASFNSGFLPLLAPIAAKEVKLSEELLPYIVDIIMENHEHCPEALLVIQKNVSCFFENHFRCHQSGKNVEDGASIYFNRKSVQCMLSIINFCRIKTAALSQEKWMNYLRKLNVNFLHVAYAAQFCHAYFTSLLYAEIWAEYIKLEIEKEIPKHITLAPLDLICRTRPEEGILILNLLWENYKEIGESDSVESCARLLISDPQARMRYFKEMGLWQQLVAEAEIEDDREALSHGLLMSGMFTCASHVQGFGWEAAWRLMQWNIEQPLKDNKDFSSLHYSALRSILHLKDKQSALIFLESAKKLILSDLAHASLEVAASVYLPLAKLQLVSELESWCTNQEVNQVIPDANWIHIEPLLMQRGLLWGEAEQWISTAKIARKNSSHLIARSLINKIKKSEVPRGLLNEAKFEEAQIHWESGSSETAKFLLKNLLNHDLEPHLKLKCLLKYGNWMSETKSQSAKEIIEDYFKKASDISLSSNEGRLEAAECLAKFSDTEFQRLDRYLRSPEYENKVSHMRDTKENLKAFQSCPASKLNNEELKSSKIYQYNLDIDKAEIETICEEHSAFLKLAVREYLYSLQHDAASSDKMFRFVSLWLSNNRIPGLKEELDKHLDKVPSYRFIPVFPQLSVRISLENSHFSRTLTSLLERCSIEHPHHCLWHLLALANAEKDQPKTENPPAPRVQGSIKLLTNILKNSAVGKIVKSMQDLALAYISFANLELPKAIKPGESFKIPKNEKLREMKDLTHIASATVSVPVNKSANYKDIPGLVAIEEAFQIAGGINQPKKIKVLSSDGKVKTELVKGKDDIRQDALMQQVFSVLNTLLESDEITSRRRLNIRTYKVVPMTQKSGVIEWCSNTEPLGSYLSQAHPRHRPQDMSQLKCKLNLQDVAQKSNEEKLKMFKIICSKFKPVMRHFFLERYLTPGVWYEKRLAFTRSVATNSMIGYVMGIGDRHVFNILIDNETAEVIHIDFGISFELGRILPTPETVPFRLTRDIEDGMGITGVEGAFRKCCEETLRVLRKKSEPILTTLEALLYDPLYSWSVKKPRSEQSQQSIPDISMDETNKLAERFLQRLQLKLEGREDSGISSIEAQVRNLIIEAKDPNNLSRLFRGWQAYL